MIKKTSDMLKPDAKIHHKRRNTKRIPASDPIPMFVSKRPAIFVDKSGK